ncbi:hypothetical protein EDB81DRAFT_674828 [Dactylonectria macrodidyma]|uniref:Short-chain dehydrogenase/reductase n=1 Tax=Dactylonectria macrodidyma TaxID=307937 RepID=A0A9P9JJ29_9HYPO|nr:hypothetical protein EDB81DRAFT_674828 [Dactylonectria macrodidyma]
MSPKNKAFNPATDIPRLDGKIILITGGNIGLGKQSSLDLSKHNPAEIWLAARNEEKAKSAIEEVKGLAPSISVRFLQLDLASFDSIKAAARTFRNNVSRLDILLLNAGVMGGAPGITEKGYEKHWGVNHMGHALLLKLLQPLLLQTATQKPGSDVRVISLSSTAHKYSVSGGIKFSSVRNGQGESSNGLYGQSKLANLIYTRQCAKHWPQITFASVHPGIVKTDLQTGGGNLLMRGFQAVIVPIFGVEVEEGAKSQLWAATAKGVVNGEYYEPVGIPGRGSALSKSEELGDKLWAYTQKELEGLEL